MQAKLKMMSVLVLTALLLAVSGCSSCNITGRDSGKDIKDRPDAWAQKIENQSLKNFHKVSADLYRGAQPDNAGMKELKRLGIRTVINLRQFHSDDDELKDVNMKCFHFKLEATDEPAEKDVVEFLRVMNDKDNYPVYIHCKHGSDRTGMMCAIYRIVFENWDRDEAIREWQKGGFGYHDWFDDIVEFVQEADFEKLKKEAGIK